MHILIDPSFFFTKSTGAPHGETLGLMKPKSMSSWSCIFNSSNSFGAIRYGAFDTGAAPGSRSIVNSNCRSGGGPGNHVTPRGVWNLLRLLKVGSERKLLECSKAFTEFIYPHIRGGGGGSMLRAFERVYREKKIGSTDGLRDFLKDTSLNLMFAGRDTTSTCLTWLFWLVAQNPGKTSGNSCTTATSSIFFSFFSSPWR